MTLDFRRSLYILVPLLVGAVLYLPYSPGWQQRAGMAAAEEQLPEVRAVLAGDPRYSEVDADVYTGMGGAVGLHGTVERDDDLFRLMKAVAALRLPVPIHWQVEVLKPNAGPAHDGEPPSPKRSEWQRVDPTASAAGPSFVALKVEPRYGMATPSGPWPMREQIEQLRAAL